MYNEEYKKKFINEFTESKSRKVAAERLFDFLEPYERELDKDVYAWSNDEIRPVLEQMFGITSQGRKTRS